MKLVKEFHFDSAHFLPNYGGKCKNMHGHTYRVELTVEGPVDQESGMVMDFAELKGYIKAVEVRFDHKVLNEVMMKIPTAENIAMEILNTFNETLPESIGNISVKLWEGLSNAVIAEKVG